MQKSGRVVISDPKGFLTFMVKELGDYAVLTLNTAAEEMNARHQAMTVHRESKVIFLCFFPEKDIRQLMEFAGVGGHIDMEDPDTYVRRKLYEAGLGNVTLAERKLLLAAKLSIGKDLTWWKGVVNGTIEPLDLREHLAKLIEDPERYEREHDEDVFGVFRDDLHGVMGKPTTAADATSLLKELTQTIFDGLALGNISDRLLEIYEWWSKDTDLSPTLKALADAWSIPADATCETAHPDHPFEALDRRLLTETGERIRDNRATAGLAESLRQRIESPRASRMKPDWLKDLLTLLETDTTDLYRHNTLQKVSEYYRKRFAPLDAAMRHLYGAWLGDPQLLRPLQELYETHLKSMLVAWFSHAETGYSPDQTGLIRDALTDGGKKAVIVCDGLRLEMAECIAQRMPKETEISREYRHAKLPSVTENGMSALFGLEEASMSTAARYDRLRADVPDVEITKLALVSQGTKAKKLVAMYGDIDIIGEHKSLDGLKEINGYEEELAKGIQRLHRLGYKDVWLTSDHGFVITGLLDEADKVAAPAGADVKERFLLSDIILTQGNLIRREDDFPGGVHQYYAKTDRPFRTRGEYGYSHGGFTPQECLIPYYRFSTAASTERTEVTITNREALAGVTGQYFTVRLKGNESAVGSRIKVNLHANGAVAATVIVKIGDDGEGTAEFETMDGAMSVTVQDTASGMQLDNAPVKRSANRDLGGLL